MPRDSLQVMSLTAESGAETPLASAAIRAMVAAYNPTHSAVWPGKSRFTNGTTSTFAMAMPLLSKPWIAAHTKASSKSRRIGKALQQTEFCFAE
ncbi:hypothetical protein D3C77_620780 [compost metagenome]